MKILALFLFLMFGHAAFAQSDEDAIKHVISTAYIEGIHNGGETENIRKGFHPTFTMLRMVNNEISPLPIEEWITSIEKSRKENPAPKPRAEGKFIEVDVTGNVAVVKLELYRESRKIFTDYLVLYKFTEGWRIVSKTFYRHP
jgi:hypothetical protein